MFDSKGTKVLPSLPDLVTSRPRMKAQPAGPKITLCFLHPFVSLCIPTYHEHSNYVAYIVAMQPYFSWLWQFRQLFCVATMSSLAQLRVWDWYWEAEAT